MFVGGTLIARSLKGKPPTPFPVHGHTQRSLTALAGAKTRLLGSEGSEADADVLVGAGRQLHAQVLAAMLRVDERDSMGARLELHRAWRLSEGASVDEYRRGRS